MKRSYIKPDVFYESLSLSHSIASGCEAIAMFGEGSCPALFTKEGMELMIFQGGMSGCMDGLTSPDEIVCYHAPTEANNIFSS